MEKMFKVQKIMFYSYILLMVVSFLYSLSFMTDYANLFGFEFPKNMPIAEFHDSLQSFNKVIFWFSAIGAGSILAVYALELNKKVPDKFALILISVFILINLALAVYGLINLGSLKNTYNEIDFQYRYLEDNTVMKGDEYVRLYGAFNLGNILYLVLAVFSLGYALVLCLSHITFLKNIRKAGDLDEVRE